ncbi:MAG TPA: DUF6755 family protein [Terriglobales bacterium]|nr:DUF6755 family protein [Terriglobales bacterium]
MATSKQGLTLFNALLFFVAAGVVVQTWLLWNAVDALLAKRTAVLIPTLLGSGFVALLNGALVTFLFHFDRKLRRP